MQRYPLIDALRGFAALWVVFFHVIGVGDWKDFPTTGIALLPRIGWLGVDLFLVISGFVIGRSAIEGFNAGGAWRSSYTERRLRRIVPLYILTLACSAILVQPAVLRQGWTSVLDVAAHLLFLHNLAPTTHGSINGPSWSIALEMQFYALMLLATPWIARSPWWKVVTVWAGLAIAWRYGTTVVLPPGSANPHFQFMASTQLPGVLDEFVAGIGLAKLAMAGKLNYRPWRMLAWVLAAVVLLGAAWTALFTTQPGFWSHHGMVILWRSLLAAGLVSTLACVVMLPGDGGWMTRPLRYLGEISYGIYLWHFPVLLTLIAHTPLKGWALLLATLASTLALAALSWHGFEKFWLRPRPAPVGT